MNHEYLVIPRLEVRAANAQSTWWLINAAPVMAANLFAHNLGRATGAYPQGVGILHHDAQLLGEVFYDRLKPQQRRGAVYINVDDYSSKNKHALSLQPTASCHLRVTLVLEYDALESAPPSLGEVNEFLHGARLAGGHIVSHGEPYVAESLALLRRLLTSGYWIVERQDLLASAGADSDPLDGLIAACGRTLLDVDAEKPKSASWIAPTTLGYAMLSDYVQRPGTRGGYPHAYAEPLVGLVQYVPLRELGDYPPLWRTTWPRDDVFLITQKEG